MRENDKIWLEFNNKLEILMKTRDWCGYCITLMDMGDFLKKEN